MYAIFEDGGKQYKVSSGDALLVEIRDLEEGQSEVVFDQVLMIGGEGAPKIGAPLLAGATVTAKIVEEDRQQAKVVGIKFRRRKGYMKKFGHRQRMMRVEIGAING